MTAFCYTNFFDTEAYAHAAIFERDEPVWQALNNIAAYIKTRPRTENSCQISPQAYLVNPELISFGRGCIVEAGAYIQGPCVLGNNCTVRHAAYIRGNFVCGDNCTIGHCSEVKNAIFLNDVHADHFAYVGDSILGNHAHLGAGVKCANLRLDNAQIIIRHAGLEYPTGRRKFGAIIGDRAQLGCNAVTNPGTLLGKNVRLFACTSFGGGLVPDDTDIRLENKIKLGLRK